MLTLLEGGTYLIFPLVKLILGPPLPDNYCTVPKIFMRFLLPSSAGINVAEEPFHQRLTVVEGCGSKSALIKIHLSSIYMLISVTKHACLLACLC